MQKLSDALTSSRRGHCFGLGPSERLPPSLQQGQMINGVMWGHVTLSQRHNLASCGLYAVVCSCLQTPTVLFEKIENSPALYNSCFVTSSCHCTSGFAGTPGYLSPEVLRKDPYGKPVDIWACGESSVPDLANAVSTETH